MTRGIFLYGLDHAKIMMEVFVLEERVHHITKLH
jgi:hypothetical protein